MAKFIQKLLFTILTLFTAQSVYADDIDILEADRLYDANILFIMDLSGSMNYGLGYDYNAATGDPTRLEELTLAFNDIINNPKFDDINLGLATFSGIDEGNGKGHGITYPVKPLTGTTAQSILNSNGSFTHSTTSSYMPAATAAMQTRNYLSAFTADTSIWAADGSTPIVDALFEAALYFRSGNVHWGNYPPTDNRSAHPSSYTGVANSGSTYTENASCPVGDRVACSCGSSCGISELSSSGPGFVNSPIDTGGCTLNPTGRTTCLASAASCGTNTNCAPTSPNTVYCGAVTIAACQSANPTYENCSTYSHPIPNSNSEGQTTYTYETRVRCEEPRQQCDANASYSCPTTVTSCTKCPDTVTNNNPTYISPITEACPKNGIILLTDGAPTSNQTNGSSSLNSLLGTSSCAINDHDGNGTDDFSNYGRCGPEIAQFMASTDHADGTVGPVGNKIPDLSNDTGIQNVFTYTVGLSLNNASDIAYMKDIASNGQGAFVNTSTRGELTDAFINAITGIVGKARSFAAPTYSVDTSTLLSHGDEVYIPMFDRKGVVWPGNLKKFKLSTNGELLDKSNAIATDVDGNLLSTAQDLWSDATATGELTSGGAANKINPATRNILTDNIVSPATTGALIDLDTAVGNGAFGLSSSAADTSLKTDLVKFIKGSNPDDTPRNHMGDIIHSKPVKLNIAGLNNDVIFVGTNEGYLHAIKDTDGSEVFAYMPRELLLNIKDQFQENATPKHIYGVDGQLTLWLDESANTNSSQIGNNVLDIAGNERAYLFFGLRRGGTAYHALDVTDPANPVLKWKKAIGTGHSWSQPVITKVKDDANNYYDAVVVGGGYNEDVASGNELVGGNGVHIVRADNGADIWQTPTSSALAPNGSVANAVPAKIRVIDLDRNGLADRLYFGDTGGNIWRVDLNAGNYSATTSDYGKISKSKLYKVASLGAAGTDSIDRKFFEEPDVAVFRQAGKFVATIAIGSGDRTRPLDGSVDDRFFLLYDKQVMNEPLATTSLVTMDASTGGLKASSAVVTADLTSATFRGWHKSFSGTGEKVLATAVTFQNKVLFTTFATLTSTPDACNPSNTNESRLYIMDLLTGTVDTNIVVTTGEILGEPQINFGELKNKAGTATCNIGTDTDCKREITVRVGRAGPIALPVPAAGTPLPDAIPRIYWIDNE